MMIRSLILSLALGSAFAIVQAAPSYAQTTETDQSEEDWRKSRKKRSTTPDIFDPNVNGIGQGLPDIKPLTPIEKLPRDSQRHLKRLRAEIIAESDPGQPADTAFEPSEAAKNDPDLAAQEEEAWKIIVTDLELGSGQSQSPQEQSQDGEKIAVAGRNTTPPKGENGNGGFGGGFGQGGGQSSGQGGGGQGSGVIRGGSSSSVADILAQIKGIKAGRGQSQVGGQDQGQDQGQNRGQDSGQGQGPLSQGQQGQNNGQDSGRLQGPQGSNQISDQGFGQGQGQSQQGQTSQSQTSQDQNPLSQAPQGQSASQSGAGQSNGAQAQNQNQNQGQQSDQSNQQGNQSSDSSASRAPERLSPLDTLKRERDAQATGNTTNARDFLKKVP